MNRTRLVTEALVHKFVIHTLPYKELRSSFQRDSICPGNSVYSTLDATSYLSISDFHIILVKKNAISKDTVY
jgi:hypothetical protein